MTSPTPYPSPHIDSGWGYHCLPPVDDSMLVQLPRGHEDSDPKGRYVKGHGQMYELWSPNSKRLPVYPGGGVSPFNIAQGATAAPTYRRFDGSLGIRDPTLFPQPLDTYYPYYSTIPRIPPPGEPCVEWASLTNVWVWHTSSFKPGFVEAVRSRVQVLRKEMERCYTVPVGHPETTIVEERINNLERARVFEDCVLIWGTVQRSLKLMLGWLSYVNLVLRGRPCSVANDSFIGFWANGCTSSLVTTLLSLGVPTFIIHQMKDGDKKIVTWTVYNDFIIGSESEERASWRVNAYEAVSQRVQAKRSDPHYSEHSSSPFASALYPSHSADLGYVYPVKQCQEEDKKDVRAPRPASSTSNWWCDVPARAPAIPPIAPSFQGRFENFYEDDTDLKDLPEGVTHWIRKGSNHEAGGKEAWDRSLGRRFCFHNIMIHPDLQATAHRFGFPAPKAAYGYNLNGAFKSLQASEWLYYSQDPVAGDAGRPPPSVKATAPPTSSPLSRVTSKPKQEEVAVAARSPPISPHHLTHPQPEDTRRDRWASQGRYSYVLQKRPEDGFSGPRREHDRDQRHDTFERHSVSPHRDQRRDTFAERHSVSPHQDQRHDTFAERHPISPQRPQSSYYPPYQRYERSPSQAYQQLPSTPGTRVHISSQSSPQHSRSPSYSMSGNLRPGSSPTPPVPGVDIVMGDQQSEDRASSSPRASRSAASPRFEFVIYSHSPRSPVQSSSAPKNNGSSPGSFSKSDVDMEDREVEQLLKAKGREHTEERQVPAFQEGSSSGWTGGSTQANRGLPLRVGIPQDLPSPFPSSPTSHPSPPFDFSQVRGPRIQARAPHNVGKGISRTQRRNMRPGFKEQKRQAFLERKRQEGDDLSRGGQVQNGDQPL